MTKVTHFLFFALVLSISTMFAQRPVNARIGTTSASLNTAVQQNSSSQKSAYGGGGGMHTNTVCDTLLNIDLGIDTLANYTVGGVGGWGYVGGHNSYGDIAKAEFYNYSGPAVQLTGIIYGFAVGSTISATSTIQVTVWADNAGVPGAILGTQALSMQTIAASVLGGLPTPVTLTTPVTINGPFYVGIEYDYLPSTDTVALYTNLTNNTPFPGTAWEQWGDLTWHEYSETPASWGLNVSSFVAPILCSIASAPVVDFAGTPTTVCKGQSVSYMDLSTNTPTSWSWSFPGGTPATSTAQNPIVTYNTAGTYGATLVASNVTGSGSLTKNNYITVNTCVAGCDTLANVDGADTLALYTLTNWGYVAGHNSFGDISKAEYFNYPGPTAQLSGILYLFGAGAAANASSSIQATVWADNAGVPGAVLSTQSVSLQTIAADVTAGNFTAITLPTPINISGPFFVGIEFTYAAGDTVALITNRDGNSPAPGTAWEQWSDLTWHAYSETPASWGVNVSHVILPILCTPQTVPPIANFTVSSTSVCTNVPLNFSDLSSGSPTAYLWSFPGGTPSSSTLQNPSVSYATPGTYSVTLIVSNSNGSDSEIKNNYITVTNCSNAPVAAFSANTATICSGQSISFYNTSSNNPTSFQWSFPGGNPASSTQMNPIVNYPTAGTYTVTLIATNSYGSTIENKTSYITVATSPTAGFTGTPTGNGGVQFNNTSTGNPTSYAWSFVGGTPSSSTQINPAVTYPTSGAYTAILTASNACGNNTFTDQFTIEVTGIDNTFGNMLSLYPNPNEGSFILEMQNVDAQAVSFQLFDVQGKLLHSQDFTLDNGNLKQAISIPQLAAGSYFAKVSAGDKTANFKVLIQK